MATLIGTPDSDTLSGTDDADLILGRGGDDRIDGLAGDDALLGERGGDQVTGGVGDDRLFGDGSFGQGPVPRRPETPAPPGVAVPGNNEILGGGGGDTIFAGYGTDTVDGGAGNDRIVGTGPGVGVSPSGEFFFNSLDGGDSLSGGAGDDSVEGGGGDDALFGGAGGDTLWGGIGADTLTGGSDGDVFLFRFSGPFPIRDTEAGEGRRDVVLDFQQRQDVLDLSGYANPFFSPPSERPEPLFLGTGAFEASSALQVRYQVEDGRTVVQFFAPVGTPPAGQEPTAPAAPNGEIVLAGEYALTESDFVLGPEEPVFTTLAVGEEGGDFDGGEEVVTPLALGEEGDPGSGDPIATTLMVGEEGEPEADPWGA